MEKIRVILLHGGPGMDYGKSMVDWLSGENLHVSYLIQNNKKISDINQLINLLHNEVTSCSDKPYLIGHSFGGVLALEYSKIFEDYISGMIVMNAPLNTEWVAYLPPLEKFKQYNDFDKPIKEKCEYKKLVKSLKSLYFFNYSRVDEFIEDDIKYDYSFFQSLQTYMDNIDFIGEIGDLKIPILNIYSEYDQIIQKKYIEKVLEKRPTFLQNSVCINDCGHFCFVEQPERTKKIVYDFLNCNIYL